MMDEECLSHATKSDGVQGPSNSLLPETCILVLFSPALTRPIPSMKPDVMSLPTTCRTRHCRAQAVPAVSSAHTASFTGKPMHRLKLPLLPLLTVYQLILQSLQAGQSTA